MRGLLRKLGVHNRQDAKRLLLQVIKFGIVGLSNTLVSLAVYYLFVWINKDLYMQGNFWGFVISVANAFFWNYRYVFHQEDSAKQGLWERIGKPLLKSYCAYGVTFLLSQGLLFLQVEKWGVSALLAPVINLLVTIPLNFLLNKLWTFRS